MKFFAALLLLLILAAFGTGLFLYLPYGPTHETFVDIAPHTSSQQIAVQLQQSGIIRTQYAFDLLRIRRGGTLKAGEYRFDHPTTPAEIYDRILRGDVYTIPLTIPEGFNLFDISQAVASAGLAPAADFLAAARTHTELLRPLLPTEATLPSTLEGFLYPDTYRFSRHTTPLQMLTAMVHRFHQATAALPLGSDPTRTIIMASLIEKEVSQDSERPLVAGVFENRLARNMPLATDPTVIYAALLDNRWRGTIFQSDLQNPSPYNTYRHTGLPPGPICSPGMAALQAAVHPAQTDYLYFVADANGHTRFSSTLEEHANQVHAYRAAHP